MERRSSRLVQIEYLGIFRYSAIDHWPAINLLHATNKDVWGTKNRAQCGVGILRVFSCFSSSFRRIMISAFRRCIPVAVGECDINARGRHL
jgi:hypothetical protein